MWVFGTAINCIDGRVQLPVIEYLKSKYQVNYVDMITAPGVTRHLAEGGDEFIRSCVKISVERHRSRLLAIVAHHDCAGNPVDKETQLSQILLAVGKFKRLFPDLYIIGLWVNEAWQVEEVT